MNKFLAFLSLFGSLSTLLCCAIPILLVTLGMGASLAGVISVFPQITVLSENKNIVFLIAGGLLFTAWIARYLAPKPCEGDACSISRDIGFKILVGSSIMFLVGLITVYAQSLI